VPLILIFFLLCISDRVSAYPEFIGYKYSSCLTCHYNGHGNGPLNDYGRALFAAEIAGKALAFGRSDEQLGEASGFLGRTKLPNWFQPTIKARSLVLKNNPPNSKEKARYILMQLDFTLASFWREDQKLGFIGSVGYVPTPQRIQLQSQGQDVENVISREHYLRVGYGENWWFYGGMMDKVYGIRIVDHTAFSRSKTGLAQNDQAHGVIGQYIQPTYEASFNLFAGNLYQDADLRQKGASGMVDYELKEAWRVGASALYSFNNYVKNTRFGVHTRYGMGHGAAVLLDTGLIQNSPKNGDAKKGYYLYAEAIQRLGRGYHFFMTAQSYKDDMTGDKPDQFISGFGLLAFPAQRFEFRVELADRRQFTDNSEVQEDTWVLMTQAHISL
jgi:hypothetical protein